MDLRCGRVEPLPNGVVEKLRMIEEKRGEISNLSCSDRELRTAAHGRRPSDRRRTWAEIKIIDPDLGLHVTPRLQIAPTPVLKRPAPASSPRRAPAQCPLS